MTIEWTAGSFYSGDPQDPDTVICTLCPTRCVLRPGDVGTCAVRRHGRDRDGRARVETATRATSVTHLDPVERKPLYHYRPGRSVLTLAAPGCTFRCNYCINHGISQFGRDDSVPWDAHPVDVADTVSAAAAAGADLAISYTEPSLAAELTLSLAEAGRALGVGVVWKTNGFLTPETISIVAPALTAVNIDLKTADPAGHRRLTGADVAPVLAAVEGFRSAGVWVEVSTPLIPELSDSPAQLRRIAEHLAAVDRDIPWHLLRFTPAYRLARHAPTSPEQLALGRETGWQAGLRHVYVERALGASGRTTVCPGCSGIVITRDVWHLRENLLQGGACPYCGKIIAGRWGITHDG